MIAYDVCITTNVLEYEYGLGVKGQCQSYAKSLQRLVT